MPYVKHYKLPLLPFERELIDLAGITENEYRIFVAEALHRAKIRPAEYKNIPEIKATGFEIFLLNLAVGLALSAASYFLMPKPRAPRSSETTQRQLGSREGLQAFAPTSGFDTQADLANYGDPIPVIFGRYTGPTGGMLISPRLVWSRAFSYGTQQGVKQLFVVSEQGTGTTGIDAPDLQGVFLGNTPLDAAFDHNFAFYWRSGSLGGTSRIKSNNLIYGTRGRPDSGDPETNTDIFYAPTRDSQAEGAFCMAYTPSSNTEFGVYAPVYNGTDYRVNWRVVAIPWLPNQDDDPEDQLTLDRVKIAGSYGIGLGSPQWGATVRAQFQRGTGRGYSRRMGITAINGVATSLSSEVRQVSVGSTCTFSIVPNRLPKTFYHIGEATNTQTDDINSEVDTQASAADAALQLGETIQIGYTIWMVIARRLPIWQKGERQEITLRCVELLGFGDLRKQVGLVGESTLINRVLSDEESTIPISFYPLMRSQIATVRNNRPCDVTEIGIKSQVWNRANGICNFASLPTTLALQKAEENQVQLQSGTMTLYFKRTSVFAMQVRPAGTDAEGQAYAWASLGRSLCITSDQPVDIYNYIRIQHPEQRQYEYRLVPRSGADAIRHMSAGEKIWQLDARYAGGSGTGITISDLASSSYGNFTMYATGKLVSVGEVEFNEEMSTGADFIPVPTVTSVPSQAAVVRYVPTNLSISIPRLRQAYLCEILGNYVGTVGQVYTTTITYSLSGSRSLTIRWSATLNSNYSNGAYTNTEFNGFQRLWFSPSTTVVGVSGAPWTVGEKFFDLQSVGSTNPHLNYLPGIRREGQTTGVEFGPELQVNQLVQGETTVTVNAERIFERNSQLADVSFYSQLLSKSNDSSPEHSVTYVNEIVENQTEPAYQNLVMAGLALKASRTYSSLDQIRVWKDDGIPVQRFHPSEAGTVGPSNLLCDLLYFLLTDKVAGAGNTISPEQIRTSDFAVAAQFLRTNQLFFDGAISEPANIRQYITDIAPFFLCNFVISDGLFSIVPALTTTVSGEISTSAVPISGLFTGGNIIEDSFSLDYINSEERNDIQAIMRYRQGVKNQFPEERTLVTRWNLQGSADHKIESFDMTQYCTSRAHALLAAKYILSVRKRITHSVRFKTTPYGLSLAPGKFIRVITESNPYNSANNGVVSEDGSIVSASPLADGTYTIIYYKPPATEITTGQLIVSAGATVQTALYGSIFSTTTASTSNNVYMIELLTLDEEGLVEISASEFPVDSDYSSLIAQDVLSANLFITEG